jgi:MoaA/NifB/PqqE/SkfB family radical SAM enzyme
MNSKYKILTRIPKYKMFRALGFPKMLPLNLTVSVTYHCNSRCKTCNVWKKETREFSFDEFDMIFKKIGDLPYWFTISGGEPFLRKDIVELCQSAYDNCRPGIINIPTNGILSDRIPGKVEEIIESCPDTQIIINLSLDGIGEQHDQIRCVKNNYEKTMKTYQALRQLEFPNFELGIHTVISRFNVDEIPKIYNHFQTFKPDSYITEIAEERVELDTIASCITPDLHDYSKTIDFLTNELKKQDFSGVSKITQSFRSQYYELVKRTLKEKRQIIPCYAGFASAQISPDGDVWTCCIRADPIGNLRDNEYDFKKLWFNEKAAKLRESIKKRECWCPLANAAYTNMLMNPTSLLNVAKENLID